MRRSDSASKQENNVEPKKIEQADLCIEIRVKKVEKNRKSDDDGEDANGGDQFRGRATLTRRRCSFRQR
jgi:hypothetical protein